MQASEEVKQQMFNHVEQWKQSGLSQKLYCEQNDIRYYVFHYWFKRYKNNQTAGNNTGFIALDVQPSPDYTNTAAVELLLPDGKRLLFHQPVSPDYLRALIL